MADHHEPESVKDPRIDSVLRTVKDRVRGHGVKPDTDVQLISGETRTERLSGKVNFPVKAKWQSRTVAGPHGKAGERVKNAQKAAQQAMEALVHQNGPNWLLKAIKESPLKYAQTATSNFNLPLNRSFASIEMCPDALCRFGRKSCTQCNGRGSWLEFQTQNLPNGGTVRNQVQRRCMGCNGSGQQMCINCNGTGNVTRIAEVWGWVEPNSTIRLSTSEGESYLGTFLKNSTLPALIKKGHIKPRVDSVDRGKSGDGPVSLSLSADEPLTVGQLGVKDWRYAFATFGQKNVFTYRPFVFDNLLSRVISELADTASKGRSARQEALGKATDWPILDRTLQQRAANPKADLGDLLSQEAGTLISPGFANKIADVLKGIQDGLCPRWTLAPWAVLIVLFAIPAFAYGQRLFDQDFDLLLPTILAMGALGMVVSLPLTLFRRRQIPTLYRTPVEEWKPLGASLVLVLAVTGLGAATEPEVKLKRDAQAVSATLMEAPRALMAKILPEEKTGRDRETEQSGEVEIEAFSQTKKAFADLGYAVGDSRDWLSPQMREVIAAFQKDRNLTANGRMNEETLQNLKAVWVVQQVQKALNERGIEAGPEDGVMGPKTRAAIKRYQDLNGMRTNGVITPDIKEALVPTSP
jgi:hypothetical protein